MKLKVRDRMLEINPTATRRGCLRQGRVESRIEIRRWNGDQGVAGHQVRWKGKSLRGKAIERRLWHPALNKPETERVSNEPTWYSLRVWTNIKPVNIRCGYAVGILWVTTMTTGCLSYWPPLSNSCININILIFGNQLAPLSVLEQV